MPTAALNTDCNERSNECPPNLSSSDRTVVEHPLAPRNERLTSCLQLARRKQRLSWHMNPPATSSRCRALPRSRPGATRASRARTSATSIWAVPRLWLWAGSIRPLLSPLFSILLRPLGLFCVAAWPTLLPAAARAALSLGRSAWHRCVPSPLCPRSPATTRKPHSVASQTVHLFPLVPVRMSPHGHAGPRVPARSPVEYPEPHVGDPTQTERQQQGHTPGRAGAKALARPVGAPTELLDLVPTTRYVINM